VVTGTRQHARRTRRRGIALIDAIVGGVMLGSGLAVLLTIMARSMNGQITGERRVTAAWLADEMLSLVLVEGPVEFPRVRDTEGRFAAPFEEFIYQIELEDAGRGNPHQVTCWVRWTDRPTDVVVVQTLIAPRLGDPDQPRMPSERLDRDERNFGE
jgi:hypothetical protein